jgi:NAD-dependent SIR2 family protein deacetylase
MNVYLFGAGASAAEGAPATQEFFARAWNLLGPRFDERVMEVWQFLAYVFATQVDGPDAFARVPAVDEVISLVDWSLHANQGLGQRYDPPRLYQIRRDLEYLLCTTLDTVLAAHPRRADGPHARFARTLAANAHPGRCALISLNYDTLLDQALADAGLAPDYGLHAPNPQAGPLLAKLHGSLHWALCPACGQIEVGRPACRRCDNRRLHALIISPTLLKSYEGAHLQQIWDQALACMQQAERLVFVGYSLPQADVAVYHLIRRGLLAGRRGAPHVTVINHTNPDWSASERDLHHQGVRARFTRLFGADVAFDFNGFHGQV